MNHYTISVRSHTWDDGDQSWKLDIDAESEEDAYARSEDILKHAQIENVHERVWQTYTVCEPRATTTVYVI